MTTYLSVASILYALVTELAKKTQLHRFVDDHSNANHQLRLIGRVGQKQTDKVSDFIARKYQSHIAANSVMFSQFLAQQSQQQADRIAQLTTCHQPRQFDVLLLVHFLSKKGISLGLKIGRAHVLTPVT